MQKRHAGVIVAVAAAGIGFAGIVAPSVVHADPAAPSLNSGPSTGLDGDGVLPTLGETDTPTEPTEPTEPTMPTPPSGEPTIPVPRAGPPADLGAPATTTTTKRPTAVPPVLPGMAMDPGTPSTVDWGPPPAR